MTTLTLRRYVAAEDAGDDEVFSEKTQCLIAQLARQMAKVAQLDPVIRAKLAGLRYALDVRESGHEHSRS